MLYSPIAQIIENFPRPFYFIHTNDPVINAVPYLVVSDIDAIAIIENNYAKGMLVGYNIISLINKHGNNIWSALYKTRAIDIAWSVLTISMNETLFYLIKNFQEKNMGYSLVLENNKPISIIGLLDIIKFYAYTGITNQLKNIRVYDLLSKPLIKISAETSLKEAISIMLNKRVRRLFIEKFNLILSDRSIIRKLLTFPLIERLRDKPREVLAMPIRSLTPMLQKPGIISHNNTFDTAVNTLLESEAHCLVTDDFSGILTPWDLVVKTFSWLSSQVT
jgi:predicted transcriptional regulator